VDVNVNVLTPLMRRFFHALVLLASSALVVCGVKGSPHPPSPEPPDAGIADGGGR
jgi:predicted small lipoprotein YifL